MRARNLKPGLFRHAELTECSIAARWLFAGLGCLADCEGRFENKPKQIKMELVPCDDVDVTALLLELSDRGLIAFYGGAADAPQPYAWIPTFQSDQNPHHTEVKKGSRIPPHPDELPAIDEEAMKTPEVLQETPGNSESTPGNSESTPGNSESTPADSRLPTPDSRFLTADSRLPTPDSAPRAPSVGRSALLSVSALSVSALSASALSALALPKSEGKALFGRLLSASGDPAHYKPWWFDVGRLMVQHDGIGVVIDAIEYAEKCRDPVVSKAKGLGPLSNPGAYIASKCKAHLEPRGVRLPAKPTEARAG